MQGKGNQTRLTPARESLSDSEPSPPARTHTHIRLIGKSSLIAWTTALNFWSWYSVAIWAMLLDSEWRTTVPALRKQKTCRLLSVL